MTKASRLERDDLNVSFAAVQIKSNQVVFNINEMNYFR